MGYVKCNSCKGSGNKSVWRDGNKYRLAGYQSYSCRACEGTGVSQRLYSKNCEKCGTEIIYPMNAAYSPKYCKPCKAVIQHEKELNAAKWKTTCCKSCRVEIKYNIDWTKIPDTCKSCAEKERAKWKEARCKTCGATIKDNTDWTKIPDLCKSCVEKEKAKIKSVRCKWCHSEFKINTDWTNPPELRKDCQAKIRTGQEEKATIWRRFRRHHDPIDKLPTQVIWNRHDSVDTPHHITIKYADDYRASWEATRRGDFGFHWTKENNNGPNTHEPPDDATV